MAEAFEAILEVLNFHILLFYTSTKFICWRKTCQIETFVLHKIAYIYKK